MPKPEPAKPLDPIALLKAAQATAHIDCTNLATQLVRSEQFANEVRTKLIHAQGRYAACVDLLKELEAAKEPQKAATP